MERRFPDKALTNNSEFIKNWRPPRGYDYVSQRSIKAPEEKLTPEQAAELEECERAFEAAMEAQRIAPNAGKSFEKQQKLARNKRMGAQEKALATKN